MRLGKIQVQQLNLIHPTPYHSPPKAYQNLFLRGTVYRNVSSFSFLRFFARIMSNTRVAAFSKKRILSIKEPVLLGWFASSPPKIAIYNSTNQFQKVYQCNAKWFDYLTEQSVLLLQKKIWLRSSVAVIDPMFIPEETITNVNDKNSLFKGLIFFFIWKALCCRI